MHKKIYLAISVLILAALLTGSVGAAFAQSKKPITQAVEKIVTRTVTVTGSGQVYLTPDIAHITIGAITQGNDPDSALTAEKVQAQKVNDALLVLGIAKEDIQTTNFSIYPQPEYDTTGNPTDQVKYIVNNSVFVTVRYIPLIGDVLNAAFKAGAKSISAIQFDVGDQAKTTALTEAREAAVKDARKKADELAKALDVSVGEVQTISESSRVGSQPMNTTDADATTAEATSELAQAGQILLTVEVIIVYEILPISSETGGN